MKVVFAKIETLDKGKDTSTHHFFLLSQSFQKVLYLGI